MIRSSRRLASLLALPAVFAFTSLVACTADSGSSDESTDDELNYRSTAGQEFTLSTTVPFKPAEATLAMPAGDERDKAIQSDADALRNTVTTAIVAELDRLWPEDYRVTRAGVSIEYRQGTSKSDVQKLPDGSYTLTVSGDFAGVKDLERKLPMKTAGDKSYLPVPADLGQGAGSQELQVTITPSPRSLNAYPKYLDLFADGALDIGVHVGGDHNTPPQDINHARSIYEDLVANGFKSPVSKFENLKIDSGPLTSKIKVQGRDVDVRVKLFHVDMSTPETRDLVVNAYKASAKDADVIIYDGHAGRRLDYSGVVLAYNPARASIPASEFKSFETTDKQQIYLFNGCETYTGYADKLYENPARKPENTDVITTGNFSAIQPKANQVIAFIHSLIDQKSGAWIPQSWDTILSKMNAVGERSWVHVYGVHGLDDNPRISPLADASKVGVVCRQDTDCGAPDSKCIQVSSTKRVCGAACADTSGCPSGTKCVLPRGRTASEDLQCAAN